MNIAIIIAGGVGSRFGADIPKQFVEVEGKPIIEYTLKIFQEAESIDRIIVVCVAGWEDFTLNLKKKYNFTKVVNVVSGGSTRFYSIVNGLNAINKEINATDIIVFHDAVRPCIDKMILESSIDIASKYGAALAVAPCFDTMFVSKDGESIDSVYPREKLFKGQTPESMQYGVAMATYQYAVKNKLYIDSPTSLLIELKKLVGLSKGSQSNIKVTTKEDIIIFKTMLKNMENNK